MRLMPGAHIVDTLIPDFPGGWRPVSARRYFLPQALHNPATGEAPVTQLVSSPRAIDFFQTPGSGTPGKELLYEKGM